MATKRASLALAIAILLTSVKPDAHATMDIGVVRRAVDDSITQWNSDVTDSIAAVTSTLTTTKPQASPAVTKYDYVGYVFVPLLFVTGLVGNSLIVAVMTRKGFRSMPVSTFLVALAVSDTWVNLLFPLNKPFIRMLLGSDVRALSQGGCKLCSSGHTAMLRAPLLGCWSSSPWSALWPCGSPFKQRKSTLIETRILQLHWCIVS